MRGFPRTMFEMVSEEEFWRDAEELLHVTRIDELDDPVFAQLQVDIDEKLTAGVNHKKINHADFADPARLAVGMTTSRSKMVFKKFSTPGLFLKIYEPQRRLADRGEGHPLMIATDTVVGRFEVNQVDIHRRGNIHTNIHTSRGALRFPQSRTNSTLATNAIPATTILMNSLGDDLKYRAGQRLGGHFITRLAARFPIPAKYREDSLEDHLKIGASYVVGKDPKTQHQYHIQINAIHSLHPEAGAENAWRLCPDYSAAATAGQLAGSEDHNVLGSFSLKLLHLTNTEQMPV